MWAAFKARLCQATALSPCSLGAAQISSLALVPEQAPGFAWLCWVSG